MRVFLTGFMGCGKSTVGRLLAESSGLAFVDLDRVIEEASGQDVPALFRDLGEAGFRRLEASALRAIEGFEEVVVATGGGTPLDPGNRQWMRAHGTIVWLDVPAAVLLERLAATPRARPLFTGPEEAAELLAARRPAYGDCDVRIALTGQERPERIVERLRRALRGEPGRGPS